MTDNLPAKTTTSTDVTAAAPAVHRAETDDWIQVMAPIVRLAEHIAETEFVPRGLRGSAPATAAALLYGREVGLPPMTALTQTHVIEGRPGMSAEAMRAMVYAAGHEFEFIESTGAICRVRGRRRGSDRWVDCTWTLDMAKAAGLAGKDNWRKYPRRMLQARATGELCEMVFPDVIHGFKPVEELQDALDGDGTEGDAPAPSTTVRRARGGRKTTATTPPMVAGGAPERPASPPVPLPGEAGFDLSPGSDPAPADAPQAPAGPQAVEEPTTLDGNSDAATPGTPPPGEAPASPAPADQEPAAPAPATGPRLISRAQQRMLMASFRGLGLEGEKSRAERMRIVERIVGREVDSTSNLTVPDATKVIDTLARVKDLDQLEQILAGVAVDVEEPPTVDQEPAEPSGYLEDPESDDADND